jgi:hypothetical protein
MTIIGTKVRLARDIDRTHPCCDNVAIIAPTTALHCATCNSFRGWASKAMVDFINTTARRFGRPQSRSFGASRRPTWLRKGMAFAWFIWDHNHAGPTVIDRISWGR